MTARDLLAVLIKVPDLDQPIDVITSDNALLGMIRSVDHGVDDVPRIVLRIDSFDAAVMAKGQALRIADGDEELLQRLRDSGVTI